MNTDLISKLIAAGTPAELVAEVALALGRAQGEREALERRRESDRERQAKKRQSSHVMSRDTSALSRDVTGVTGRPFPQKTLPASSGNVEVNQNPIPTPLLSPRPLSDWPEDFREVVWEAYGQRREKKASMAALEALWRSRKLSWSDLTAAITRQAENVEPQFRPSLERWIKREKWTDEYSQPASNGHAYHARPPPERPRTIHDVARDLEARFARPDDDEFDLLPRIRQQAH